MSHKLIKKSVLLSPLLLVLCLSGCTTDGGNKAATKVSTQMNNSSPKYILVTGGAGKEPTLGAPQGAAPTTLVSQDLITGTGAEAGANSTLTVHYVLMAWSSGKVVQSSWSGAPATFPLAGVIKGWQQGMPGMKEGGRRLLIIPPELGYGANGGGPIGANETLVFVVDLVKVA